jgi:succinyl-diaminopimelate desuccinylase
LTTTPCSSVGPAAQEDHATVVRLTRDLVRIPSRAGIDSYSPLLDHMTQWLGERGLSCQQLIGSSGDVVALSCEVAGKPGPHYVLNACLDTAPFGDESAWTLSPTSGEIIDGWLHGRGAADSKAGAAIFAHIATRLQQVAGEMHGNVTLLFDVDEHTGSFGGAKAYFGNTAPESTVAGVMIGYPGLDHVVTGSRGVLRARFLVHGVAGHSGSKRVTPNAVAKAAVMIQDLSTAELLDGATPSFPLPARLTVTAVDGGEGYSIVPDLCRFNVDVRLTPAFDDRAAADLLRRHADAVDSAWPDTRVTDIEITTTWPPFSLPDDSPLRHALLDAAAGLDLQPTVKIAGPSNIGNYLAGLGIPATAGFGVGYEGLHGTDERIRIDSIPAVQQTYHQALLTLLHAS